MLALKIVDTSYCLPDCLVQTAQNGDKYAIGF